MKTIYYTILLSIVIFTAQAQFYSQDGQDKYIYEHFFNNKETTGTFVEIGAHDGISYSNTYFFEKNLGWQGICIEPMPTIFKDLEKNRSCLCINGCITDRDGFAQFLFVNGPSNMLSGLMEKYDARHLQRIDFELKELGGTREILTIQCYTLNNILQKQNIDHIDYLSIDTEGNELDILKSINFDKIFIDVITVENNYDESFIRDFLEGKGYRYITRLGGDEIYRINR